MPAIRRRTLALAAVPTLAAAAFGAVQLGSASAAVPTHPVAAVAAPSTTSAGHAQAAPSATASGTAGIPGNPSVPSVPAGPAGAPTPGGAVSGRPVAPLTTTQLPNTAKAAWKPIGPAALRPTGHHIGLNECAGVDGATAWLEQGWASAANTPAIQDTFTFPSGTAATAAFRSISSGMNACQTPLRSLQAANHVTPDALLTLTTGGTDATAWQYRWNAIPGMSAPGHQIHHVYLAVHGSQLTVLQYTDLAQAGQTESSSPAADQAVLATLTAQLRPAQ